MRISRSPGRRVSSRRAHRPDQRVYRSLRLNRRRRDGGAWLAVLAGVAVAAVALVLWWVIR